MSRAKGILGMRVATERGWLALHYSSMPFQILYAEDTTPTWLEATIYSQEQDSVLCFGLARETETLTDTSTPTYRAPMYLSNVQLEPLQHSQIETSTPSLWTDRKGETRVF